MIYMIKKKDRVYKSLFRPIVYGLTKLTLIPVKVRRKLNRNKRFYKYKLYMKKSVISFSEIFLRMKV